MSRSPAEKISVLEGLLGRVQRNAAAARAPLAVALAREPASPPAAELEVVEEPLELGEHDEIPTSADAPVASAPAPAPISAPASASPIARVALVQVPEAAPTVGASEKNEVIEELAEEDEVLPEPIAELEAVDEALPPSPVPAPVAQGAAELRAPSSPPPPEEAPARAPPKRSESIELAIQAAAAAQPVALGEALEAHVPQRADAPGDRPSDAQLGAIIELEEGPSAAIELAPARTVAPAPPPHDEEEVLPAAQSPGRFAPELVRPSAPPPPSRSAPPPPSAEVSLVVPPSPPPAPAPPMRAPPAAVAVSVEASATARATLHGEPALFVAASKRAAPATFGELLDDALALFGEPRK